MFDAVEFEKLGKPTITISHDKFEKAARLHAEALGIPELPLVVEPAPSSGNVPEEANLTPEQIEFVLAALTRGPAGEE